MSEVAEKLRKHANAIIEGWEGTADDWESYATQTDNLCAEGADEIDRLTAALAEARDKALQEVVTWHYAKAASFKQHIIPGSKSSTTERASLAVVFHEGAAEAVRALKEKP